MKYRMIIADDEPKMIQLIKQLDHWTELDIEIIDECRSGQTALNSILKNKPDFVIFDIKMPVYDGIELIEKVKQENVDTLFILISGYRHFEYARKAIQLNVMDYLLKPIDETQLNITLSNACRRIDQINHQKKENSDLATVKAEQRKSRIQPFWDALQQNRLIKELSSEASCNDQFHAEFTPGYYQVFCGVTNLNSMLQFEDSRFSDKVSRSC